MQNDQLIPGVVAVTLQTDKMFHCFLGMSMLQNGKLPQFIDKGILSTVLEQSTTPNASDAIFFISSGV